MRDTTTRRKQSSQSGTVSAEGKAEVTERLEEACQEQAEDFQVLMDSMGKAMGDYCRRRPGVAAGALFALGFFVGWKIKPW